MQYGDEIAVTDSEKKITYLELNQKAICIGQYFMEKGICKDDKVLVQMPNRISFVAVLFALAKIRTVPIMMLPAHREAELEGIIALAKPTAYVVAERYLGFSYVEMAMNMQKKLPCIQNVFVDGVQREEWYEPETEGQGEFPEVDSYSTAVLLLPGGTTGVPKLIPRAHTDYMYNARMSAKRCQLDRKQYCLEQKEYRETHPENAAYSYWRKRVTELPPAPDLPYKKKLSELCGHRFDRISQKFSREETSALYKLVKDNRVTPAALICTMYMKTLMQYSKNKEFSLNLTLFNRLPLSEEIYNLIGDFTNIGAIAYRQQKDFWQEVNFVQKQLWELVRYHSFDGTQILKMIDPMNRGKAILPVVFTGVLQGDRKTKGFLPNGVSEGYAISQTPQVVLDYQATDFNGELLVNWDYVIDAFDVEMIHSMFSENIKDLRLLIYS